ncbi:hypothetical protein C0995_010447 [Termitomyces sp. Mi166|nr:hypothetical protein C0995_010447 [Termitomyces sp. Mi166\
MPSTAPALKVPKLQRMHWPALASLTATFQAIQLAKASLIVPHNYTVPGVFPTSVFSKYYNNPTATSHEIYPFALTNPDTIPLENTIDPHILPPVASSNKIYNHARQQIASINNNSAFAGNNCARCVAILEVLKFVALAAPEHGPDLAVDICNLLKLSSTCKADFGLLSDGSVITQVVGNMDAFCSRFVGGLCPAPATTPLDLRNWFKKPKPKPLPKTKKPSGKRLKVLHMSDFHIDPSVFVLNMSHDMRLGQKQIAQDHLAAAETCPPRPAPTQLNFLPLDSALSSGNDTPMALGMAALQAIPALADTGDTGFAWTIYTGDLVSHDSENQLSRRMLGTGPVYAALGNHDTYNSYTCLASFVKTVALRAQDAPSSLGGTLAQQFNWNYDHVADLWKHEKWLPGAAVDLAKEHYAAYMVKRVDGLRVITLNTDIPPTQGFCSENIFNYMNMTNPDVSGMLRFLTDELQSAEDAGDRAWIIGHVLSGWDGGNSLENPTNLFYQIVDRYSPHVIANIFFGHTHEDHMSIFYANNATIMSADTAQALAWHISQLKIQIGPSVTPITNLNSGFRVYEVDSATFEIMDAHTWKSDVSSYPDLDGQATFGPEYTYEYNTRETYGKTITSWTANDPLNATWWHLVTEG